MSMGLAKIVLHFIGYSIKDINLNGEYSTGHIFINTFNGTRQKEILKSNLYYGFFHENKFGPQFWWQTPRF